MTTYGLLGYPLSHSFSQKYFTEKFQLEGIADCSYQNFEREDLHGLKTTLPGSLAGLNVTIPHKERILDFLDTSDQIVKAVQACNCIKIAGDKWSGFNTDVIGFQRSFSKLLKSHHTHALILGTGGASKAVAFVLDQLNIDFKFVSTSKKGDNILDYASLNQKIIQNHPVIINTTPLGTFPGIHTFPDISYDALSSHHYLYDLVYNPAKTLFLEKGERCGSVIKNGKEMLEIQAEESWKIWNSDQ